VVFLSSDRLADEAPGGRVGCDGRVGHACALMRSRTHWMLFA
jgi:hypothetical protein